MIVGVEKAEEIGQTALDGKEVKKSKRRDDVRLVITFNQRLTSMEPNLASSL